MSCDTDSVVDAIRTLRQKIKVTQEANEFNSSPERHRPERAPLSSSAQRSAALASTDAPTHGALRASSAPLNTRPPSFPLHPEPRHPPSYALSSNVERGAARGAAFKPASVLLLETQEENRLLSEEMEAMVKHFKSALHDMQEEMDLKESTIQELRAAQADRTKVETTLRLADIDVLKRETEKLTAEVDAKSKDVTRLSAELAQARSAAARAERDAEEARRGRDTVRNDSSALGERVKMLLRQRDEADRLASERGMEVEGLADRLREAERVVAREQARIRELETEVGIVKDSEAQLQRVVHELNAHLEDGDQAAAEVRDLRAQMRGMARELEEVKEDWAEERRRASDAEREVRDLLEERGGGRYWPRSGGGQPRDIGVLQDTLERERAAGKAAETLNERLTAEVEQLRLELERYERASAAVRDRERELADLARELEAEALEAEADRRAAVQKADDLQAQCDALERSLERLQAEQKDALQREGEADRLERRMRQAEVEVERLHGVLKTQTEELEHALRAAEENRVAVQEERARALKLEEDVYRLKTELARGAYDAERAARADQSLGEELRRLRTTVQGQREKEARLVREVEMYKSIAEEHLERGAGMPPSEKHVRGRSRPSHGARPSDAGPRRRGSFVATTAAPRRPRTNHDR